MELLVGAGSNRAKKLFVAGRSEWDDLVTLDINPAHKPDLVWDLNQRPLPIDNDEFDEIHAYEVLEHIGRQGDWRSFFEEWSEWWRILKPGGRLFATSPHWQSAWAWGDPGHTRVISIETLTFLVQPAYAQVGVSSMTDYRFVYKADFDCFMSEVRDGAFFYGMQAVKPSRCAA